MAKWIATMPREAAKEDHVHFVLAIKPSASRMELSGQMSVMKANLLWRLANMRDESIFEKIGDIFSDNQKVSAS